LVVRKLIWLPSQNFAIYCLKADIDGYNKFESDSFCFFLLHFVSKIFLKRSRFSIMATRREVNQQKLALSMALREQCRVGQLMPGEPAPPLRQLAEDFRISTRVANQVLQELISEGLFHMVPRVGTFVGQPRVLNTEFYLMVLPHECGLTQKEDLAQIQQGFEERIAEKGSASLVMPLQIALHSRESGDLPPLAGVFDMAYHPDALLSWGGDKTLPLVGFSGRIENRQHSDEVSYDDEGGGRQAARHLMALGHRNIAFLGLHSNMGQTGELIWSQERENGWRQALVAGGLAVEGMAFHPFSAIQNDRNEQIRAGRELGTQILRQGDITAVVAANDFAAAGFLEATRASGLPSHCWPSVVGFDNRATENGHIITSLRLPAEHVGRTAADLLWERNHGQLVGPPVHRRATMRLIPRLTSHFKWSIKSGEMLDVPSQLAR
jgi:DNA-binding LacI/PurR family transcriptional regulator